MSLQEALIFIAAYSDVAYGDVKRRNFLMEARRVVHREAEELLRLHQAAKHSANVAAGVMGD